LFRNKIESSVSEKFLEPSGFSVVFTPNFFTGSRRFSKSPRHGSTEQKFFLYSAEFKPSKVLSPIIKNSNSRVSRSNSSIFLGIFDSEKNCFYAPFVLAVYILIKKERFSEHEFFEIIQGFSPYSKITDIDNFIDSYKEGDVVNEFEPEIPAKLENGDRLEKAYSQNVLRTRKAQLQPTYILIFTIFCLISLIRFQNSLLKDFLHIIKVKKIF